MLHSSHPWISLATGISALPQSSVMLAMRKVSYQRSPNEYLFGGELWSSRYWSVPAQDYVVGYAAVAVKCLLQRCLSPCLRLCYAYPVPSCYVCLDSASPVRHVFQDPDPKIHALRTTRKAPGFYGSVLVVCGVWCVSRLCVTCRMSPSRDLGWLDQGSATSDLGSIDRSASRSGGLQTSSS